MTTEPHYRRNYDGVIYRVQVEARGPNAPYILASVPGDVRTLRVNPGDLALHFTPCDADDSARGPAWVDWPDAPGFWWARLPAWSHPVLALVDDELDAHNIEDDRWWFRCDAEHLRQRHGLRFLATGLVRPETP